MTIRGTLCLFADVVLLQHAALIERSDGHNMPNRPLVPQMQDAWIMHGISIPPEVIAKSNTHLDT